MLKSLSSFDIGLIIGLVLINALMLSIGFVIGLSVFETLGCSLPIFFITVIIGLHRLSVGREAFMSFAEQVHKAQKDNPFSLD